MTREKKRKSGTKHISESGMKRARKSSSPAPKNRQKQETKSVPDSKEEILAEAPKLSETNSFTARKSGQIRTPPSEPPTSVPANHALIPPEADDLVLRDSHDIHTIPVVASANIQGKVTQVIALLYPESENQTSKEDAPNHQQEVGDQGKPVVISLVSRGGAVNKCIAVAEIAKRELGKASIWVWQYTGSWSRLEAFEPKKGHDIATKESKVETDGTNGHDAEDEEDGEAFETMDVTSRKLMRNTPCLVIYLSNRAIPRMKELYG